ncbi:MAG: DUF4124 domain-containing protein, partial [Nitrospira sp.]
MEHQAVQCRTSMPVWGWMVLIGLLLGSSALLPFQARAATIYSYIDEQGNPRFSDTLENIPEKYRAKVKTHEQAAPQERPPSVMDSVRAIVSPSAIASFKQTVVAWLQSLGVTLPSVSPKAAAVSSPASDMNTSQSKIVTYAGAAAMVLLLVMYFSKSQLMRLLGLCLLITLGVATPILLYVSDDGPMTSMKGR